MPRRPHGRRPRVAIALALSGILAGCAAPLPDPPVALSGGRSAAAAEEVAAYAAQMYGHAVSHGPGVIAGIPGTDCWYCSTESQILADAFATGAPVTGGRFFDVEVVSTSEDDDVYEVELRAHREAIRLVDGSELDGRVAGPAGLTVAVRWTGSGWSVDDLTIEQ